MAILRGILVVIPAFLILHITMAGFALPAIQNGPDFMEMFELTVFELTLLALAPAIAYAAAIPKGAVMAASWSPRVVMTGAVLLSLLGCVLFAFIADGFWMMFITLVMVGGAAGMILPLSTRLLGGLGGIVQAGLVGFMILAAWFLSIAAAGMFSAGLPIPGPPGWAGTFLVQGFLAALWFLPVLLFTPKEPLSP